MKSIFIRQSSFWSRIYYATEIANFKFVVFRFAISVSNEKGKCNNAKKMFSLLELPPQEDPNPLPLTSSPWPILIILAVYMLFVLKLGKILMRNREPYKLQRVLRIYNLIQVAYNGIFFGVTFYYLVVRVICNPRCMETFPFGHEHKNLERYVHFAYFFNKILDLLDTVFFVLRKKYKQISFLHVYHHAIVLFICYATMRFYGTGGHLNSVGLLNSFVHAVMYFYYFLSAERPGVKASIWWKKYITIIQLIQFVLAFIHASYVLIFSRGCGYPRCLLILLDVQALVFMYMFGKFYYITYIRTAQKKQKQS
ncbi:elongation of very long chain fatty acids protein F-like [Drosophila albomicans]|uniref:Elongation of very long chain fatty acids protein n=1 Tax=Drosophila albomicans TaxID=7291 RepID=A0A6P8XHG1_DROAB|nr:elongation of very long chain fatty acids protein F-like [Drosophila albomicans]